MTRSVTPEAAIDNDALIKLAAYQLLQVVIDIVGGGRPVGMLGAGRFVVPHSIGRHRHISDPERALSAWNSVARTLEVLEPTNDEVALAASIEETAISRGLAMDTGESQLCAIAIRRGLPHIVTGDKRAICAAEALQRFVDALPALARRFVCLEQVLAGLVRDIGVDPVRTAVCAEPGVDKAAAICFACSGMRSGTAFDPAGLASYTNAVRDTAPSLLWQGDAFPPSS